MLQRLHSQSGLVDLQGWHLIVPYRPHWGQHSLAFGISRQGQPVEGVKMSKIGDLALV